MRITQRTPDGKKYIPDDPIKFDVAKHTIDKINPIPLYQMRRSTRRLWPQNLLSPSYIWSALPI